MVSDKHNSNLLSIGKMAEINHLSVATLRLYDRMGLLEPVFTDSETGYRYYSLRQNARLDMIAYMKDLGMSLSEIGDILSREDINLIEDILIRKNEQIHAQIAELRLQHERVGEAIRAIERRRKSPTTGTISLEYIDRRYIWCDKCARDFYRDGIMSYEEELFYFREKLLSEGFTHIQSYSIGTSVKLDDYVSSQMIPDRIFIFLDYRTAALHSDHIVLDSAMHACIYAESFDEEAECAAKLLSFCRDRGYRITGDYICEVMNEENFFDSDDRRMFLRLQVPVVFR